MVQLDYLHGRQKHKHVTGYEVGGALPTAAAFTDQPFTHVKHVDAAGAILAAQPNKCYLIKGIELSARNAAAEAGVEAKVAGYPYDRPADVEDLAHVCLIPSAANTAHIFVKCNVLLKPNSALSLTATTVTAAHATVYYNEIEAD